MGSPFLKPTSAKLRGATGAELHALGTCLVKGASREQPIELEVIVPGKCSKLPTLLIQILEAQVHLFNLTVSQLDWQRIQATQSFGHLLVEIFSCFVFLA